MIVGWKRLGGLTGRYQIFVPKAADGRARLPSTSSPKALLPKVLPVIIRLVARHATSFGIMTLRSQFDRGCSVDLVTLCDSAWFAQLANLFPKGPIFRNLERCVRFWPSELDTIVAGSGKKRHVAS